MTDPTADSDLPLSAFVILGMVRLGRRSGYEIKQAVQTSINFFWRISEAQIYPQLQTLEQRGLLQGRDDPQGRRPRRIYDLTPAGRRELQRWLSNADPLSSELRDTGLLKVFFADALDQDQALALLDSLQERSRANARELQAILPRGESAAKERGNVFPSITLRLGIAQHQAIADMCAAIQRELAATDPDA